MKKYPPEQEERTHVFSVVECALGWMEGLKLLCGAGYHVTFALEIAIFRKDVDLLRVLLEDSNLCEDFPILTMPLCQHCPRCRPGTSIWPNEDIENEVFDMFIHTFQSRRRQLRELACTNLPTGIFQSLGLDDLESVYFDAHAHAATQLLDDHGIDVPLFLRPSSSPIFHTFDISCPKGGVRLADRLYKAGFRQIDAPGNSDAETPLQKVVSKAINKKYGVLWCRPDVVAVKWLIDHGAGVDELFGEGRKPLLHGLAECYDGVCVPTHPWYWDWTHDPSLAWLQGHPASRQTTGPQQYPRLDEGNFPALRELLGPVFRSPRASAMDAIASARKGAVFRRIGCRFFLT